MFYASKNTLALLPLLLWLMCAVPPPGQIDGQEVTAQAILPQRMAPRPPRRTPPQRRGPPMRWRASPPRFGRDNRGWVIAEMM